MQLRRYRASDCDALLALFRDTVRTINRRDYTPEQIDAWAYTPDISRWRTTLAAHDTLIAEQDGIIVGFADMDEHGYLDRLYVHAAYQRQGIAKALCDALEQNSPANRFTTAASVTAKPFFEHRGYTVVREQQVERHGVLLNNFVMKKQNR